MSLELHELVAEARSACSTSVTERPRPAASRAMPAPLMPPPTTSRSTAGLMRSIGEATESVPPEEAESGLGVRDDAITHPFERVFQPRLEHLEVLAHVELRADVAQAAR